MEITSHFKELDYAQKLFFLVTYLNHTPSTQPVLKALAILQEENARALNEEVVVFNLDNPEETVEDRKILAESLRRRQETIGDQYFLDRAAIAALYTMEKTHQTSGVYRAEMATEAYSLAEALLAEKKRRMEKP